jgi:cytochrome c-type biogenesis protein CcmH/NrfF
VLSILIWWAIPAVAVTLAAVVAAATRRVRRAREDVGTLRRYQRARQVLERTQRPPHAEPPTLPTPD